MNEPVLAGPLPGSRWRGVPTRKNIGGATERPTAQHVWKKISAGLTDPGGADAGLDQDPELDSRGIPWPIFMTYLLANGWFIRPRTFPYRKNGASVPARFRRVKMRIALFAGAWVAALIFLPIRRVLVAAIGWVAMVTPGIRFINQQFQNVRLD